MVQYYPLYLYSLVEENKRNLDEFEYASLSIKNNLNSCKEKLKERTERIALFGYQSKERIRKSLSIHVKVILTLRDLILLLTFIHHHDT